MISADYISTTQVAESLGVSVSTVKRWVEEGVLPAQKTAGGHRKLLWPDVVELARRNNLPLAGPLFAKRPKSQGTTRPADEFCDAFYECLIAGDLLGVRKIVHSAYDAGTSVENFADTIVRRAMHRVGSEWERGRLDVFDEHRATQTCLTAIYELRTVLESSARRARPVAVGGAIEGDYSELPSLLAQMVLLQAGWDAVNLGPNTPFQSFTRALTDLRPKLFWISFSHVADEKASRREYKTFFRAAESAGVPVMIGGQALTESLRSALPYTAYGDGLANLAGFARTLHQPARPPKRGRPPKASSAITA